MWRLVAGLAGTLAGMAARAVVLKLWKVGGLGDDEPQPAHPATPWRTALGWAVASGVATGVARVVAMRTAAEVWERATDEPPPIEVAPA
jgi:hypothetical protein